MRHNSPALFHLKLYVLWTKRAHQSANFRLATARIKIHLIPHVIFGTKNQFFFKLCIICTFSSKILYALDERSPSKSKFSDFRLLAWKLTKFLVLFLKPRVSFPLNFASPFSVMIHNSYEIFWLKYYMLWTKRAHQSTGF